MFYAEINDKGFCHHCTDNEIPNSIEVEKNVIGWSFINNEWIKPKEKPQPTQLDTIQNNQLTIMEAMADQHEENLENQIVQMDVLATIYETQLESQEGSV